MYQQPPVFGRRGGDTPSFHPLFEEWLSGWSKFIQAGKGRPGISVCIFSFPSLVHSLPHHNIPNYCLPYISNAEASPRTFFLPQSPTPEPNHGRRCLDMVLKPRTLYHFTFCYFYFPKWKQLALLNPWLILLSCTVFTKCGWSLLKKCCKHELCASG